jgi:sporulation protein YlmC with PRC-barrel domain
MTTKNYELDNNTGLNHYGPTANRPVRRLTAKSIINDPVYNTDGESIGTIREIMINVNTGRIDYLVVSFGGIFGFGAKLFAIAMSEFKINEAFKALIIDRPTLYFDNFPGFDKSHWPCTNTRGNHKNERNAGELPAIPA